MTFAQPFQDYEILDRVGAGAMGTVFKSRHKRLNRIVALKVLKPSLARDVRYVDRLRREARIVASLNHPNIVTGYDLGEEGGYHYFVMEFVEGKSLRGLLVEWGMFAEEYVQRVARQVAQALDHAYQRGVIHRDIKPGNILIDERGDVKLTDMGLAKGPADLTLTRDGATVGTPQYISPEQARNPQDVDVRSDLYSLGATLYHMATGVPPFRGDTMAELLTKVLHDAPTPPNELNPALSEGLSLVIRKLLAKDLRVRYQTPRELLDDLDRVEQQLQPNVDVSRLAAGEASRPNVFLRSLLVVAVMGLIGLTLWIGTQLTEPVDRAPTPDEFLEELDAKLLELPTPGARFAMLRTTASPPPGSETPFLARQSRVLSELQAAVDEVVATLLGPDWPAFEAWVRDPLVWPDRARCERERIEPRVRALAGVTLAQLPPSVRTIRIDDLLRRVDRELSERDRALVMRFSLFLSTTIPERADERLRAGDYAAAERTWRDAVATFCDGVRMPLPERLAAATANELREAHRLAWAAAAPAIDSAESSVAAAMRGEVESVVQRLDERLAAGDATDLVSDAAERLRNELSQVWPAPGRFRPERDPWPEIERRLGTLAPALASSRDRAAADRVSNRCDLAWRTYCQAGAADALVVLSGTASASPRLAEMLARHRAALEAAAAVERAILETIARANGPVIAFPLVGQGLAVELRVEPSAEGPRLVSQSIGQPSRTTRLAEFRFADLLSRLRQDLGDPLRDLAPERRAAGVAVATMAGGDLAGMGELLASLTGHDETFLVEEVWPRILAVRGERSEQSLDRESLFASLRNAREAVVRGGSLSDLEAAVMTIRTRITGDELSEVERTELRGATRWLQLERRRRDLTTEIESDAPSGASVSVQIDAGELAVDVALGVQALHRDAAEGWHVRGDALQFAGGARPWGDLPLLSLRCDPGLPANLSRATMTLDLVIPPTSVGRRLYVVEFRGVAVLLAIAADDTVHAALVDGDPRREDVAQRAFRRAMSGTMAKNGVIALPGAVHSLRFDIVLSSSQRRGAVTIDFEGSQLLREEARVLEPQQRPTVVVYPQQELRVHRLVVRAGGL
jgi:tRNA A-37 threonylcarbamoyl transferase component Bud32